MSRPLEAALWGMSRAPAWCIWTPTGPPTAPPDGYTKEDLLTALEGGKDILPSIWTNLDGLDIDPDILY